MSLNHSKPMLVYLGANAHLELMSQLLAIDPDIRYVESAVYPEREFLTDADPALTGKVMAFDADLASESGKIGFTPITGCNYVKVIDAVMCDKQLSLLWTRFGKKTKWQNSSEVKRYEVTYSLIKSAIAACTQIDPGVVLFSYEPHMLPIYLFKKVCEALGIPTYTLTISPFIWRVFLEAGNSAAACRKEASQAATHEAVQRLIDEKRSDYSIAKPFYEKRNVSYGFGKRHIDRLKVNGWKLHKFIPCQMGYSEYQKLSTGRGQLQGVRYLCVFLQLQPEQTTLPDGGLFVHHLFGIQMLHAALAPLGISLVVREHPATFEYAYDMKWRPADFYRTIRAIGDNIYFDDIHAEPYSLIKNSLGVCAITGSVLLEALLQGRPAIAFGKHPLKGYSAPGFVDSFADEVELRDRIAKALEVPPAEIAADVEGYLHGVYDATLGPDEYVGNAKMSLDRLREARYQGLRQAVELIARDRAAQVAPT